MRYGTETDLAPDEVINLARGFFGGEWGLKECGSETCAASFEGGGGGVTVSATTDDGHTAVELLAREWDRQAQEFLRKVKEHD
jgi:hypothetical protein